jgi:tRNA A-37 threonylcarbamoyl transferase component Bud32
VTYETIGRIGRGGMGVVDLARGPDGEEVALKRLSLHGTPEELAKARARIRREADVLTQLDHPGVVRLREVIDEDDDLILVMDYLPGGNLATRVAEHGPLAPDEVARLADHLLDALAAAHRQGIVHRDVKPANVLFDAEGDPHLADFGVAVHRDATQGLTATEMVVGTPGFMSPEQARGEEATAASDVFCLGATLLFAATGVGPFGVGDARLLLLRAAAGRTEKVPKTLPPDLRRRIEAMLAKDPAARPSAAAARGGPEGTHPRTIVQRAISGRNRWALVGAVLAVCLAGAAGLAVLAGSDGNQGRLSGTTQTSTTARPTTTTTTCVDLPYQPCGGERAPNTDGRACTDGYADYDEDPANGCEAAPDDHADDELLRGTVRANLVPADDVDTYLLEVGDGYQLLCDGELHVTLTAPRGLSLRVTVLDGDVKLGSKASSDGTPATVTVRDPGCLTNDATTLRVKVESVGSDRSTADYELTATGSF